MTFEERQPISATNNRPWSFRYLIAYGLITWARNRVGARCRTKPTARCSPRGSTFHAVIVSIDSTLAACCGQRRAKPTTVGTNPPFERSRQRTRPRDVCPSSWGKSWPTASHSPALSSRSRSPSSRLQPWQPPTARPDPLRHQPFPLPRIVERLISPRGAGRVTPQNRRLSPLVPPSRSVGRPGAIVGARRLIRPTCASPIASRPAHPICNPSNSATVRFTVASYGLRKPRAVAIGATSTRRCKARRHVRAWFILIAPRKGY